MPDVRNAGVLVIGGGPAGLFCAIRCAEARDEVVVLEKMPSCGRKLLMTGSGQCNLTHEGEISGFFSHYGDHGPFLRPALMNFTNRDLADFFESRGLSMVSLPGGKVFPSTKSARDVLDVLLAECSRRNIAVCCNEPVRAMTRDEGTFAVETVRRAPPARLHGEGALRGDCGPVESPCRYLAEVVVLATGGASYPATGSSGDGYLLMRGLGHPVTGIAPALAPAIIDDYRFADLAGVSFDALEISIFRAGRKVRSLTGDLLFTHDGLSGPGVLDLSRHILPRDELRVSFLPGHSREEIQKALSEAIAARGPRQVKTILRNFSLPERFVKRLMEIAGIPPEQTCSHIAKKERNLLVSLLSGFPFTVRGLAGFDQAMATRGGAALEAVNPKTMESREVPGLYIVGEALDIDGDTGGYNLQAAFSTAALAAAHIARQNHGQTGAFRPVRRNQE